MRILPISLWRIERAQGGIMIAYRADRGFLVWNWLVRWCRTPRHR